jgi:hypothetical protein
MTISAKFASQCPVCGQRIYVGTKIEWSKGERARHTICPTGAAKAPAAPRKTTDPGQPGPGEIAVSRRSSGRDDCYEPGAIIHATRLAGGGGPDGKYFAVVRQTGRWRDDDEWMIGGILRAATDAECAPSVAARAKKDRREKAIRATVDAIRAAHDGEDPRLFRVGDTTGAERIQIAGNAAYSHTLYLGTDRCQYVESSTDDWAAWTAPMTDSLRAVVAELRAAISKEPI